MPKYTITTDAGAGAEMPGEPIEFPHTKAATDDAQVALAEMARDKLPNGKTADFGVKVEDEGGKEVSPPRCISTRGPRTTWIVRNRKPMRPRRRCHQP